MTKLENDVIFDPEFFNAEFITTSLLALIFQYIYWTPYLHLMCYSFIRTHNERYFILRWF